MSLVFFLVWYLAFTPLYIKFCFCDFDFFYMYFLITSKFTFRKDLFCNIEILKRKQRAPAVSEI